jgi:hypothetical protein
MRIANSVLSLRRVQDSCVLSLHGGGVSQKVDRRSHEQLQKAWCRKAKRLRPAMRIVVKDRDLIGEPVDAICYF